MFRFEHTEYLWAFILVPLFIALFLTAYYQMRMKQKKLADNRLFSRLIPEWSELHLWIRFSLVLLILISLVIGLSNPQWATKREKVKAMSSDIFIALDISQSMMVQDIPPNRLERAKKLAESLIISLKGNRIGLIFFAGEAYIQMPLTSDYAAALMFLKSANPQQIEAQGTAIVEALDVAEKSFLGDRDHQRAMIIITDGEDHDGEAIERASSAHADGLTIFTLGVGTAEGDFIPYTNRMGVETYKTDVNGNYIKSRVNVELLDAIASSGGGKYYSVLNGESSVQDLVGELERIEKIEVEQRSFTSYESYYQYFLLVAIVLLVLELALPEKVLLRVNSEQ
jgi:Ca-activated chloride channel family protein